MFGLPEQERKALMRTQEITALIGTVIGIAIYLIASRGEVLFDGTASTYFVPYPLLTATITILIIAYVFTLIFEGLARLITKKSWLADKKEEMTGLPGEIIQLPVPQIALFTILTGIWEELFFRLGLTTAFIIVLLNWTDIADACWISVILSTAIFGIAHVQYKNVFNISMVMLMGGLLCLLWMFTGHIACAIIVHALYDFINLMYMRHKARKDPDKEFFGARPQTLLTDKTDKKNNSADLDQNTN